MRSRPPARLLLAASLLFSCLAGTVRAEAPNEGVPVEITAAGTDGPTFQLQAEYLLWALESDPVSHPLAVAAAPGGPGGPGFATVPVFANQRLGSDDLRSGLRLRAALMASEGYGVEVGGFLLEQAVTDLVADPASAFDTTLLARPFIDSTTGRQGLNILNLGTGSAGSIHVNHNTTLWGAEANVIARECGLIEGYFGGYRYLALRERLRITDRTTTQLGGLGFFNGQPVNENDTRLKTDEFETSNDFHGAQVGLRAVLRRGAYDLSLRSSVALGVTQQTLDVRGNTTLEPDVGSPVTLPGGLLAARSNIRSQTKATFAVAPEVDLSVGVQLARWARLSVGYNFLYVSSVIRPGAQIDPNVNPAQLPTSPTFDPTLVAASPAPTFKQSDFWAQGLNFGLSLSY
jgi:hypothetical protein